jgi:hypothetical protein
VTAEYLTNEDEKYNLTRLPEPLFSKQIKLLIKINSHLLNTFLHSTGAGIYFNQGCGSGSGLDPDSVTFVDPDP